MQENRQRKIIDLTSYTSTEKWKLFESITHVHINRLGTTPLLYLSFMLISAYFVEVLLKSCLNVLLKLFHTGNQCRISAISYNQMSPTQDIQMLFNSTLHLSTPNTRANTNWDLKSFLIIKYTYMHLSNLSEFQWNHSSYLYIFQELVSINNNF